MDKLKRVDPLLKKAMELFNVEKKEVTKEMRRVAKIYNHAYFYGRNIFSEKGEEDGKSNTTE